LPHISNGREQTSLSGTIHIIALGRRLFISHHITRQRHERERGVKKEKIKGEENGVEGNEEK
jgi:hypothetical protein